MGFIFLPRLGKLPDEWGTSPDMPRIHADQCAEGTSIHVARCNTELSSSHIVRVHRCVVDVWRGYVHTLAHGYTPVYPDFSSDDL